MSIEKREDGDARVRAFVERAFSEVGDAAPEERSKWVEDQTLIMAGGGPEDLEFDRVIANLHDPDPGRRRVGLQGAFGICDPRLIEHVIPLLEDEKAGVRFGAANTLSRLDAYQAAPALLSHLASDEDEDVRAICASSVGWMQVEGVTEALVHALSDGSDRVVTSVCSALCRRKDPSVIVPLLDLLEHHPSWDVQYWALMALFDTGCRDTRLLAAMERLLADTEKVEETHQMEESFATFNEAFGWERSQTFDEFVECVRREVHQGDQ